MSWIWFGSSWLYSVVMVWTVRSSALSSISFAVAASTACLCGRNDKQSLGFPAFPSLDALEILLRELVSRVQHFGQLDIAGNGHPVIGLPLDAVERVHRRARRRQ